MRKRRKWTSMLLVIVMCICSLQMFRPMTANAASASMQISGNSHISSIQQGKSWTCNGTITSNYKITKVAGWITDLNYNSIYYGETAPNATSYRLNGGAVDKALLFNKLSAGSYYYIINAWDSSSSEAKALVCDYFTVNGSAAASTLKFSGNSAVGTLTQGSSWSCNGTVSSNYKITNVTGKIIKDGSVLYTGSAAPNAASYSLKGGAVDKALLFNKLAAGTYHYVISAKDASGLEKQLWDEIFTIKAKAAASTLKLSGNSEVGTLTQGSSWSCNGTVSSNYKITNVTGKIIKDGSVLYTGSAAPNAASYSLKGGAVDKALLFNKLAAGTYHYVISAKDASGLEKQLWDEIFTIKAKAAASTLKFSGNSAVGTLTQGSSWSCNGTVSSNYKITNVTGKIIKDGSVLYTGSAAPNAASYSLKGGAVDKALLFNKLAAGTYHYVISAKDASGLEKQLWDEIFTIKAKAAASTLKISGNSAVGTLTQGSAWTCNGTIASNYSITEVVGKITSTDGKTVYYTGKAAPNAKSYKLNGGTVDTGLKFDKLSAGQYLYIVTAKDTTMDKAKEVVKETVTIKAKAAASTLKISGNSAVGTLTQGSAWTCNGTIASNYSITEVVGKITSTDGKTVYYTGKAEPNAKSYKLNGGAIDKALLFNKLSAGEYLYVVTAKDTSMDKAKEVVKETVTVVSGLSGEKIYFKWPVGSNYTCTQKFGGKNNHKGLDLVTSDRYIYAAASGTVYDVVTGKVRDTNTKGMDTYGNYVTIKHSNGYFTHYAHLNSVNVKKGEKVQAGSVIGIMGNSGNTTGATGIHLHFEVLKGTSITSHSQMVVDPLGSLFVYDKGTDTGKGETSTLAFNGNTKIENVALGSAWTCNGTITSNYTITMVSGKIVNTSNNAALYFKDVNPNAKSFSLKGSQIDSTLKFNALSKGTYQYVIEAEDSSGNTYHYDETFKVIEIKCGIPATSSEIQRIADVLQNDKTLGLDSKKKRTVVAVAKSLLNEGYEKAFVAGFIANVMNESELGKFENSNYASKPQDKPSYLKYVDKNHSYATKYSAKNVTSVSLSELEKLLLTLEKGGWQGKFGLGCVQWTGERTMQIFNLYKKYAGGKDKITLDQVELAETEMICKELKSKDHASIYKNWKSANLSNINSEKAAQNAGVIICKKYERPKSESEAGERGILAKKVYNIIK